jgi:elongation factor P--(R)-beta-lysine ligase
VNTFPASNTLELSLRAKIPFLIDRALMLQKARAFFAKRNVMEVDCPALSQSAPIDLHIDVMKVALKNAQTGYLHTSPEYGMKRLIAAGIGDIYQISHAFRDGEIGPLHNPEFTIVEWYRLGIHFEEMIAETLDFIRLFLGDLPTQLMSYRQVLKHYLGIDDLTVPLSQLLDDAKAHGLDLPSNASDWDRDTLLQLLVSFLIEPQLGNAELFVLSEFPASQAALSKTIVLPDSARIACRFEVYYQGIELANGYHELTDAIEQRKRLEASNQARLNAGKDALQIDERFLGALELGLPDCCGVAVGFDRLMMLKNKESELKNVLPMIWEES